MQLEVDHALDELVDGRLGYSSLQACEQAWVGVLRRKIAAKKKIEDGGPSHIELRHIAHGIEWWPGMPRASRHVCGARYAYAVDVEHGQPMRHEKVIDFGE